MIPSAIDPHNLCLVESGVEYAVLDICIPFFRLDIWCVEAVLQCLV
jgi:hypothetical protein